MSIYFEKDDVVLFHGENPSQLLELPDSFVETIITDPPYGLSFMGKKWDYDVPSIEIWKECLRILKPGGTALIFAGSRTQHRMACNVEDAGFILFDTLLWIYGSGFPKSTNIKKQLIKQCKCGNMVAYEKIESNATADEETASRTTKEECSAKYKLRLVQKADIPKTINIENKQGEVLFKGLSEQSLSIQQLKSSKDVWQRQSGMEGWSYLEASERELQRCKICAMSQGFIGDDKEEWVCNGTPFGHGTNDWQASPEDRSCSSYRPQSKQQRTGEPCTFCKQHTPQEIRTWDGWGTHLKPAFEPIICARKPNDGTYANNALVHGVSGLNIEGGRIGTEDGMDRSRPPRTPNAILGGGKGTNLTASEHNTQGRFPANIILDENYIPILCLTDNIEDGIVKAIKEFFYAYGLPDMPKRIQSVSEPNQERSPEVLQQTVLPQSPIKTNVGGGASTVREETQTRVYTENEATTNKVRERESSLQGGLYVKRVSAYKSLGVESSRIINGETNDNEGCNTRTPACNGNEDRQTIETIRAGTSQERDKGRQQAGEPRSSDQYNTQDEPQTDIAGISSITKGERRIEILDCDIPDQWLKYFKPTGYEMRDLNCAAAMLDEQSGVSTGSNAVRKNKNLTGNGLTHGIMQPVDSFGFADKGGASRFFYCAKASKKERNAGCEELSERMTGMSGGAQSQGEGYDAGQGIGLNRVTSKKNHHPTVKPLALMKYLCTLTATPTGGTIFDPFMGSGTTGVASKILGRPFIGIDQEESSCEIAKARIIHATGEEK